MEQNNEPEALDVANQLEKGFITLGKTARALRYEAAEAIRHLHARVQELEAMLEVKAIDPLTDEQLSEIAEEHTRSVGCYNCYEQAIPDRHNRIEDFARAIERAHGIGATPCN